MHSFRIHTTWTGNQGAGTSSYRAYRREHEIIGPAKASTIHGSSAPEFLGDPSRYNPEELLISALSACHMLWALHLCAEAGIIVTAYHDEATGDMAMNPDGSGQFTQVILRPHVAITDPARIPDLPALHHRAHELCFIARSVNFDVRLEPRTSVAA
ncbi:MAG: OsmC family protein [Bryobacterales bacterium]|nr:OsmC family protein [Bryobacterales bacterium]